MLPSFDPLPGARVQVQGIQVYRLPKGLPERAVVTVKAWEPGNHVVDHEGREFTINQVNIVSPIVTTDGRVFCPDCAGMQMKGRPCRTKGR